jgi:hypothetical protein
LTGRKGEASQPAVRPASLEDAPAITRIMQQLHPDRADRATLTLVDYGIEAYGTVEGFTRCTGPWLFWARDGMRTETADPPTCNASVTPTPA